MIDVTDRADPKLIMHHNWSPPFGGGTHNCLHLPDRDLLVVLDEAVLDDYEDGDKPIWLFDVREPTNPVSISTLPSAGRGGLRKKGGHFGPHNIHENRPDAFVSSETIFATLQNAGVRVFDIKNQYRPEEVGGLRAAQAQPAHRPAPQPAARDPDLRRLCGQGRGWFSRTTTMAGCISWNIRGEHLLDTAECRRPPIDPILRKPRTRPGLSRRTATGSALQTAAHHVASASRREAKPPRSSA